MLKYNKDKTKLYQYVKDHKDELNRMDSVERSAMLTLMGEQKRLMKLLEQQKGDVELKMSRAIDELIQDGVERGIEQGIEQGAARGEQRMADLILTLVNHDQQHLIPEAAADQLLREQLYRQYNL